MIEAHGGMIGMRLLSSCALSLALLAAAPAVAQTVAEPAAATVARSDGLEVRQGGVLMRVTALTNSIVRVRIARNGVLPEDASWAVLREMRARHVAGTPLANGFA